MGKDLPISIMVVAYNEEEWVKESILSVIDYVDDVVFVDDNSTDSTLEKVRSIKSDKLKIYAYDDHKTIGLGNLKNFCKDRTKNEIVVRWDADFIAYDQIGELFDYIVRSSVIYDSWALTGPEVFGDAYHCWTEKKIYGPELYVFKKQIVTFGQYNGFHAYPLINGRNERDWSKMKKHYWLHMNNLKSIDKLAYRLFMNPYMLSGSELPYYEWAGQELYDGKTPEEAKEIMYNSITSRVIDVVPFNFDKFGEHPKILLESDSINKFKVKTDNGKCYMQFID